MTVIYDDENMVNYGVKKGMPINGADTVRRKGLKDCPLCGNEAIFIKYSDGYFIKCTCCECMVALQISVSTENIIPFETMEDAAKVWNKRRHSTREANMINARETPELVLKRRAWRANRIAESIEKAGGDNVFVSEISQDTGIAVSTIKNIMKFVKKEYPQIKSTSGRAGYYWGE